MVLRELVVAAARQVVEEPGVSERLRHRRAPEGVQHRRQLPEIAQQQELDLGVQGQLRDVGPEAGVQLRDLLDDEPVQLAAPVADAPADEAVRRLRSGAQVLHGAVGLGDELDHLPELAELRHDLARQVRLPGAGHARQKEALSVQAVQEGVLHAPPLRAVAGQVGRLDAGLPVLALQALALLEAVHRRAVLVLPGRQLPHRGQELLGQVLEDQAVRLQGDDVARRDLAQVVADLRDGHVLLSHDV